MYYKYIAFNRTIELDIHTKYLETSPSINDADIKISKSNKVNQFIKTNKISIKSQKDYYFESCQKVVLVKPGIGRFLISKNEISYDRDLGLNDSGFIKFLLNACMAYLLFLNEYLVLHGSCVEKDGNINIFLGKSTSGKSSTAYRLAERHGFKVVTDDLLAIKFHDEIEILPSYQWIKLDSKYYTPPSTELTDGKFDTNNRKIYPLPIKYVFNKDKPLILRNIFFLEWCKSNEIEELDEITSFKELFKHTFRCLLLKETKSFEKLILHNTTTLLNHSKQYKYKRSVSGDILSRQLINKIDIKNV